MLYLLHCKHLYWPQSDLSKCHITECAKWHWSSAAFHWRHLYDFVWMVSFVFVSCCHKATDFLIILTFSLIQDDLDIAILWNRHLAAMEGVYGLVICTCRITSLISLPNCWEQGAISFQTSRFPWDVMNTME